MEAVDLRTTVVVQHDQEFFSSLGAFWTEHFEDRDVVAALAGAAETSALQADLATTQALQVMTDRENGPLYRTLVWFRVRVREADLKNLNGPDLLRYGFGGAYGQGKVYGTPTNLWVLEVASNLAIARCVVNKVVDPTYIGTQGSGFLYRQGVIGFRFNPFNSEYFTPQQDAEGRFVDLWFYMGDFDTQSWQKQYGLALKATGPTCSAYRALVDGLWRSRVAGPSDTSLFRVVEGCTGVPLAKGDEAVMWVGTQGQWLCVVTDKACYRFPATHQAIVEVGDALVEGQAMTDALVLRSAASLASGEQGIALPPGMFAPQAKVKGWIKFPNQRVQVTDGGLTAQGNRIAKFLLEGEGQDLARYREYAADQGLWRALDRRGRKATTVAGGGDLIPTVNPAVELVASLSRPHLVLLDGDPTRWPAPEALRTQLQAQVDRVLPPHARVVVQAGRFQEASSSFSSGSDESSSSSTAGSTRSTASSWSSVSSVTQSSNSTKSTGSSVSLSSLSDVSTKSTASTASSVSSLSSLSVISGSSLSSRSYSSASLSTQSVSSLSTRSSQSNSSLSSPSTVSSYSDQTSNSSSSSSP